MFAINEDLSIYVTRGDTVLFSVTANNDGESYKFQPDDVVRITVCAKKNCDNVVLQKDFIVADETEKVDIFLSEKDTKIGDVISKPVEYWYEVELNPLTNPQTIIGYDDNGAKVFKLFPEGSDLIEITEEDIPVIDVDFSITSEKPLANYVITKRFNELEDKVEETEEKITSKDIVQITEAEFTELLQKGTYEKNVVYLVTDSSKTESSAIDVANDALDVANSTRDYVSEELTVFSNEISDAKETSQNALTTANNSATTKTFQVDIPNDKWTEDAVNGGYICTISVPGILVTDNPIVDVVLTENRESNTLYLSAWRSVTRIVTQENTVILYANEGKPSTSFTMQLKVVR